MRVCVVDGRGGGLGSRLIGRLRAIACPVHDVVGLGTNRAAMEAMRKAGASSVATGEHTIRQAVQEADLILGSLSIVLPGAMLGEVTPGIANAILQAPGRKLLLPLNRARVEVVGVELYALEPLIDQAIQRVQSALRSDALP